MFTEFVYFIFLCMLPLSLCKIPSITTYEGTFNHKMNVTVSNMQIPMIFFNNMPKATENVVHQIHISANIAHDSSILVSLRSDYSEVASFTMLQLYNETSVMADRTICPSDNAQWLEVQLVSNSSHDIVVYVLVSPKNQFLIGLQDTQSYNITSSSPVFFQFNFPENVEQVEVDVDSESDTCLMFSVQDVQCPVPDKFSSLKIDGNHKTYQSVTRSGAIAVKKDTDFNKFYVVFILLQNDGYCRPGILENTTNTVTAPLKQFNVVIKGLPSTDQYYLPIFGTMAFYLIFYVVAAIICLIHKSCQVKQLTEEAPIMNQLQDPTAYGTTADLADMQTIYSRPIKQFQKPLSDTSSSVSIDGRRTEEQDDSYDSLSDASTDPNIYRLNKTVSLYDLARKPPDILNRKYFLYIWYLIITSVFYALPVIQLVITNQKIVYATGDEDKCFYNFRCTRPFLNLFAFNNVLSNIGYVLLGILYMLITWRRDILHKDYKRQMGLLSNSKGIPQYYGLFYAMGWALMMEGILSACYHVCPSSQNFQFDTAYMYILACLCMMKIYQIRHPDINASAHSFYMFMALFILIGVLGVTNGNVIFWSVFTIFYMVLSIVLTLEVYYMGRWRLPIVFDQNNPENGGTAAIKRLYLVIKNDKFMVFVPTYKKRMSVLIIVNVINFSVALGGVIYGSSHPEFSFATYFLAIFMINLLLYFAFYISMKMYHCERFSITSIIYIVIAAICWGFALYCFAKHPTSSELSAARSRTFNKDCIFLEFYDIHDVWHFISAMAMFFSFMALHDIDNNLHNIETNTIPVF